MGGEKHDNESSCDCSTDDPNRKCSDANRVCFRNLNDWSILRSKRVDNSQPCYSALPCSEGDHLNHQHTDSCREQYDATSFNAWGTMYYLAKNPIKEQYLGSP